MRRPTAATPMLLMSLANTNAKRLYQQHLLAPPRPPDAPDIDYGGNHPFDAHRHLHSNSSPYKSFNYNNNKRRRTQSSSTTSSTTTPLDPSTDALYQPLRIAFDTSDLRSQMELSLDAGDTVAATKLFLLIYEILPNTAEVWGDVLRVVPVVGGIYPLDAVGSSVDVILPSGGGGEDDDGMEECTGKKCRGYYEDPVRLLYCPDATAGIGGGADLLVYATVNRHCEGSTNTAVDSNGKRKRGDDDGLFDRNLHENNNFNYNHDRKNRINNNNRRVQNNGAMGTLASALSCQRDQYDRPITGSIDFCLGGMGEVSTTNFNIAQAISEREMSNNFGASEKWLGWNGQKTSSSSTSNNNISNGGGSATTNSVLNKVNRNTVQYSVGVAIHEIGHVLGVTSDSLRYFRHPITGVPLTPRPFTLDSVTCVNGETMAYIGKPGPNVMKEVIDEESGTNHYEVVTPTVRRIVRNHFNCVNATGAKLENQPTSTDCFGSHWDERMYYTEIMGAVFSQTVNVLSPLTVALLEDSGWYRANYQSEYIELSPFGHGAGCEFLEDDCIDEYGNVPKSMEEQFCNEIISVGANGIIVTEESGSQTCDPSHTSKTYCDLVDTYQLVGIGKTANLLEEPPEQFQYFGGKSHHMRPYIFTSADYCPIPHIDPQSCLEFNGRPPSDEQVEAGEYYGPNSRCIETDGSRSYSLCLQTECNEQLGLLQIMAGGQRRTCEYDGQLHTILFDYNGEGPVRIKCPKAALVCPNLFCPANCAGRGDCIYRPKGTISTSEPLASCVCDSAWDTSPGCFNTAPSYPENYGYENSSNPYQANKAIFLLIMGSLMAGLTAIFVVVRQWKARQNLFM